MSKVRVMDDILANKIAAGEVVEKCASVVKELTENAIDAGSTFIKVELIDAGTKEIKVTDDGAGMEKEDAVLAFERHATSKVVDEDDLFRIHTLGFRGEALPSIASVSKVELITSTGNVGTVVQIEGGKIIEVGNGDARKGTIIRISDLFYNTPARLKHMKSLYAELAAVSDYMNKLALSYPEIKFTLINNGSTLLNTDGSGNLLKTFHSIFGLSITKKMIAVEGENDDYEMKGYISLPEVQRSNRSHMILIVNGRAIRNTELIRSINDAYHAYKPDNRYPIVVLHITVDPSLIDVNIHPTKMDIKFSKFEELSTCIQKLIQDALKPKTLVAQAIEDTFDESDLFFVSENEVPYKKVEPKVQYEEITLQLDRIEEGNASVVEEAKEERRDELYQEEESEKLPTLYPVGSVHGTYIVCQNDKGMYLVDQHAAKERINYELCLKALTDSSTVSIPLLVPVTLELTVAESVILKQNLSFLQDLHFEIEEFGVSSFVVKAHPTWITKFRVEDAIRRVVEMVIEREKNFQMDRFVDHVAATMACKMSIKANDSITLKEMEHLLDDLRKCDNPFHCPHGRPAIVFYSTSDLEKLFKRSGFDMRK